MFPVPGVNGRSACAVVSFDFDSLRLDRLEEGDALTFPFGPLGSFDRDGLRLDFLEDDWLASTFGWTTFEVGTPFMPESVSIDVAGISDSGALRLLGPCEEDPS